MKKFTKGMLIAAGIFGAVGIGLTAAGGVMGASMSELTGVKSLKRVLLVADGDYDYDDDDDYDDSGDYDDSDDYDSDDYDDSDDCDDSEDYARAVDENVNAPLAVQDLRHGGVHLRFVRHICLQVHHARLRVFGAAAELIHFQAAAAQGARGVQADARTAAGDDGYTCFGGGCHGDRLRFL